MDGSAAPKMETCVLLPSLPAARPAQACRQAGQALHAEACSRACSKREVRKYITRAKHLSERSDSLSYLVSKPRGRSLGKYRRKCLRLPSLPRFSQMLLPRLVVLLLEGTRERPDLRGESSHRGGRRRQRLRRGRLASLDGLLLNEREAE